MRITDRLSAMGAVRVGAAFAAAAAVTAAGVLGVLPSAGASVAGRPRTDSVADGYVFATYNNSVDKTFNQLLGINDNDEIAGYLGSGAAGHPNQGYTLVPPYNQTSYTTEDATSAIQTQVTGLNNAGVTVGFFSHHNNADLMNDNEGFYNEAGFFHEVNFPTSDPASPPVDQLLGVNAHDVAVGFYTSGHGFNRGYTYNITTRKFARVLEPGHPGANLTATGINLAGFISGIYVNHGVTDGFIKTARHFITLAGPGASATQALGINNRSEVVGFYTVGTGSSAVMHGFTWTSRRGFMTVDDPRGKGTTTINGVNNEGDLVGFYTDKAGNTDGFLAIPAAPETRNLTLAAMPAGTVTFSTSQDTLTISAKLVGLTPGSSHAVELVVPPNESGGTGIGTLTANGLGQFDGTLLSQAGFKFLAGSHVEVLDGADDSAVGDQVVAATSKVSNLNMTYRLTAQEFDPASQRYVTPKGKATLAYNPVTRRLVVTVTASGLSPGLHAAHIHVGSCTAQGGVLYMLKDLRANSNGDIVGQTRVITGVDAPLPAAGWYLNLHQGNSNTILRNGMPTIAFRPLLCSNF